MFMDCLDVIPIELMEVGVLIEMMCTSSCLLQDSRRDDHRDECGRLRPEQECTVWADTVKTNPREF